MTDPAKVYVVYDVNGGPPVAVYDNEQAADRKCGESRAFSTSEQAVQSTVFHEHQREQGPSAT